MPKTNKKETVLEWEENSNHIIIVCPSDKDVLCGRGRGNFFHEGNQRFLEIVGTNLHLYITASSRSQKLQIVKAVAEKVLEEGARFLKQERGSCDWYEAGVKDARLKVSVWLVRRQLPFPTNHHLTLHPPCFATGWPCPERCLLREEHKHQGDPSRSAWQELDRDKEDMQCINEALCCWNHKTFLWFSQCHDF